MKKFNQLAKKRLRIYLSSIKTKVAIKFPKIFFLFFSAENRRGAVRVNCDSYLYKQYLPAQLICSDCFVLLLFNLLPQK